MFKTLIRKLKKQVDHPVWLLGTLGVAVVLIGIYIANMTLAEVSPANYWGIGYGTAAAVFMIGAALYAVRRRTMRLAPGRSRIWLQFHLYGGALFLLLTLMHTGFKVPNGILTGWLWAFSIWVFFSGIVGRIIQRWVPKMLASGLSMEVLYDRIPDLTREIRLNAEKLIVDCSSPVQDFYASSLSPVLAAPRVKLIYFIDITGGNQNLIKRFAYLQQLIGKEERDKLDQLRKYYRAKTEIDAHFTLQKALRWWAYLHVPTSFILLILFALHMYSVWWY